MMTAWNKGKECRHRDLPGDCLSGECSNGFLHEMIRLEISWFLQRGGEVHNWEWYEVAVDG